jgi:hypothetical protein
MKKLIVIEDNSEIKVGDVAHITKNGKLLELVQVTKDGIIYYSNSNCFKYQKVQLYIVDTSRVAEGIEELNYFENSFGKHKTILTGNLRVKCTGKYYKVIATSNPSLPLPQLSKQAIEYIVKNNGELDEFDVKFNSYKQINIIPKSSKQSVEKAAEEYTDTYPETLDDYNQVVFYEEDMTKAFIAGANYSKEQHTKNMYSVEEVYEMCLQAMNDAYSSHCLPKITDCTEWFEDNKKK